MRLSFGSPQLATYLRGAGTAVGTTFGLALDRAHDLAHRAHALVLHAERRDRRGDQVGDLLGCELLREVVGDHRGLRALLGGHLRPARVLEGLRRLTTLLGLAGEHAEPVVVGELARLLAGDL